MSENMAVADEPDAGVGNDLIAATTTRWPWQTDADFYESVERARVRRDRRAMAVMQVAQTVIENDLPWPNLNEYPVNREGNEQVVARYPVDALDDFRMVARAVRRAVGEVQTKANDNGSMVATVVDGLVGWDVVLASDSSPCERVQVGTETRTVREEIEPPRYREIEREEPVYEWRCPDSILAIDGEEPEEE